MTQPTSRPSLLRHALQANGCFSALSGAVFLLAAQPIARLAGLDPLQVRSLGPGLLLFATWLFWISSRRRIPARQAWIVVALDLLWVLGSAALLLGHLAPLTVAGRWLVGLIAVAVLLLADLQAYGLYRLHRQH